MLDYCLEPGKIEVLKMLDLQTKSALDSNKLQVQLQATSLHFCYFKYTWKGNGFSFDCGDGKIAWYDPGNFTGLLMGASS